MHGQQNVRTSEWDMSVYTSAGFRREADENCTLLGYYAARSGDFLPTFRDNLSSSRVH